VRLHRSRTDAKRAAKREDCLPAVAVRRQEETRNPTLEVTVSLVGKAFTAKAMRLLRTLSM